MPLHAAAVALLLLVLRTAVSEELLADCLPTEFHCASGQCVDGARFCDGNFDCEDGTDEPQGCTNCNRTYYGLVDVKYPLRLSEPHRRLTSSLTCSFSFVAAGGKYGDTVEVTFLSFQLGTFQLESSTCSNGYMEVEDSRAVLPLMTKRSVRPPRKSKKKIPSAKKETSKKRTPEKIGSVGSFCGPMIGSSATFYSNGDRVKVTVSIPAQVSGQSVVPRLYLTYRFLQRQFAYHPSLSNSTVSGTKCDVVLTECHKPPYCVIRSPNFPGFYLRNVTCHYLVRQEQAPQGQVAQIEVFQRNEFKINLLSGHTNNDRYKPGILTSDCAGDVIRVFDGRTSQSPLIAEFCGAGTLPPIRTSGPDMLVQLVSVFAQPLASSRFELDVRVHFVSTSTFRRTSEKCSLTIDGARHPIGILRIPDHSIPSDTTCTFRIFSSPNDRIWLYFVVYSVPDLNPWAEEEKCDVGKLEILHPRLKLRHSHHRHHYSKQTEATAQHSHSTHPASNRNVFDTFCEKRSPRQCGHSSDYHDYVPSRPCLVPNESYLSPGPELILEFSFFKAMAIYGTSPYFVARYEVVEMEETNVPELCSFTIRSRDSESGTIESPKNLFLYGRGGATELNCKYELSGSPDEKVRITVSRVHFRSLHCTTTFKTVVQKYECNVISNSSRYALLNVTESWHELRQFTGCVCDFDHEESIVFNTLGSTVNIDFVIQNMGPRDDFRTFQFVLNYEFVRHSYCGTEHDIMNGIQGHMALDYASPIRCRWLLAALPSRALYITLKGHKLDSTCQNKLLFYSIDSQQPYAAFCSDDDDESHESFFSSSWRPGTRVSGHLDQPDLTVLELIANEPSSVRLHWIEVMRPPSAREALLEAGRGDEVPDRFRNSCPLECPELEACISPDLACDGTRHCPASAADEAPERCVQFPILTVAISCATAVVIVVIVMLGAVVWQRLSRHDKTVIPPPDLFKSDRKDSSLKGHVR